MSAVIVVQWVSRVYGICTLSVVICIPDGEETMVQLTCTMIQLAKY